MQLASRFASRSPLLRSDCPLSDDQVRRVVSSIFADAPHESHSERYAYNPTAAVLAELHKEGFVAGIDERHPQCAAKPSTYTRSRFPVPGS